MQANASTGGALHLQLLLSTSSHPAGIHDNDEC